MNLNKFLQPQEEINSMNSEQPIGVNKLNILVRSPREFKDVKEYADSLMMGDTVLVSYSYVDSSIKQRIFDYLNGVSYVIEATVEKISEDMTLYVPSNADVSKEMKKRSWLK